MSPFSGWLGTGPRACAGHSLFYPAHITFAKDARPTKRDCKRQPLVAARPCYSLIEAFSSLRCSPPRERSERAPRGAGAPTGRGADRWRGTGPSKGTLGCQLSLHVGGVQVHVLLARQEHQVVHDLVGNRTQDVAVLVEATVAREVQGAHRSPCRCSCAKESSAQSAAPHGCRSWQRE